MVRGLVSRRGLAAVAAVPGGVLVIPLPLIDADRARLWPRVCKQLASP